MAASNIVEIVEDGRTIVEVVSPSPQSPSLSKRVVNQVAHGFTAGQLLYRTPGAWALAKADSITTVNAIAIVESVIDADNFVVVFNGLVNLSGLTDGGLYYLSESVAGGTTTVQPVAPNLVVPVYTAISTTQAIVNIQLGLIG